MRISIVIPLHNEEKYITPLLKDLRKLKNQIIIVDDGSTDKSILAVNKMKSKNTIVLRHEVNLGKGAAMKSGADYAFENGVDAVVFMDSDNQHKTSDLSSFFAALEDKKDDVIFGSRNLNFGVPLVRYLGNKFASVVMKMMFNIYVSDPLCGFRAFTKNGYKKTRWDSSGYGVEIETIARVGKNKIKFTEVPVETIYHDKVKGVTLFDAFGILGEVVKWKLTI